MLGYFFRATTYNFVKCGVANVTSYDVIECNDYVEQSTFKVSSIDIEGNRSPMECIFLVKTDRGEKLSNYYVGGRVVDYDNAEGTINTVDIAHSVLQSELVINSQTLDTMPSIRDDLFCWGAVASEYYSLPFEIEVVGEEWNYGIKLYANGSPDGQAGDGSQLYRYTVQNYLQCIRRKGWGFGFYVDSVDDVTINVIEAHYSGIVKLIEDQGCKVERTINDRTTDTRGRIWVVNMTGEPEYIDCGYDSSGNIFYLQSGIDKPSPQRRSLLYPDAIERRYLYPSEPNDYSRATLSADLIKESQTIVYVISLTDSQIVRIGQRIQLQLKDGGVVNKQIQSIRRQSGNPIVEVTLYG